MFPNFISHYFFISQSVPNLFYSYPAPVNSNNYQYSYYTTPYQNPYKPRYEHHEMPKFYNSKSSTKFYSQEKLIKSKSKNVSKENFISEKSSESLVEESNSFDNNNTKTRCSEISTGKKLRFIDTYRDMNYQKELGFTRNIEEINQPSMRKKRSNKAESALPVLKKNDRQKWPHFTKRNEKNWLNRTEPDNRFY
ncbi:hypothetical protein BpHYR1_022957 [Brachionus plicatilis]|uniref:Uncharacterized protein n=1 Tax=Brachionus plicatilis TaxID=10195 RepID=A0A3M7PVX4_BRAPC|nr:hypothetical protein BpHYR1_022957 [Brachionus plicatilis]